MSQTDELLANNEQYASRLRQGRPAAAPGPQGGGRGLHGRPPAASTARWASSEGDAHVIRNAGGVVTDDAIRVAGHLPAPARHRGDRPHPPHRLRDAHLHRRRVQGRDRGGHRHPARVGGRGLPRPRRRRAPVDRPDQGLAVHSPQGLGARVRLRGGDRAGCARSADSRPAAGRRRLRLLAHDERARRDRDRRRAGGRGVLGPAGGRGAGRGAGRARAGGRRMRLLGLHAGQGAAAPGRAAGRGPARARGARGGDRTA